MNEEQQDINETFSKEDAYETLSSINTWIGNIDSKISFVLAFAAVLIGVIFERGMPNSFQKIASVSKLAELSGGEVIAAILVILFYVSSFSTILCLMISMIARIKNTNHAKSVFFFASICQFSLDDYQNKLKSINKKELIDDLQEQIHSNSKICTFKAKWYNRSIKLLLFTIILWFICMIFQLV